MEQIPGHIMERVSETSDVLKGCCRRATDWYKLQSEEWKLSTEGRSYKRWMDDIHVAMVTLRELPERPQAGDTRR